MNAWELIEGDARDSLRTMDDGSAQACITSPPYYGLRDYGIAEQIGLEETPERYVEKLVAVFAEVKRVLRDDGTLWLNLGDSYASVPATPEGVKPKDLIGVPWMVAFALRADGWHLRSEVIWHKPNPMTESVKDRPTKAHEQVFLLSKSPQYFYDCDAIREPHAPEAQRAVERAQRQPERTSRMAADHLPAGQVAQFKNGHSNYFDGDGRLLINPAGRNKRSVWTVTTAPYPGAHFATFPPKLIEPMILAGCPRGGVVLDPFAGSGTTLQVAVASGRSAIGIELNPEYAALARGRMAGVTPSMFDAVGA